MSRESRSISLRRLSVFILLFFMTAGVLIAQNQITLHRFHLKDGAGPQGGLIGDAQQNLYGVSYAGGNGNCLYGNLPSGCGTVFELSPVSGGGWMEQVLYNFQGGNDGLFPMAGLIFDQSGNLYGTTSAGGMGCGFGPDSGCGTVFELRPPSQPGGSWTETVLYRFTGGADESYPTGSLLFDSLGNLYGTTQGNGSFGTVFELTPSSPGNPWVETTLHVFDPSQHGGDGESPHAGLVFDGAGNLYGTTADGGVTNANCSFGCGTVFQLRPPASPDGNWTEKIAYSFQGGLDGEHPFGNLSYIRGTLVGTTIRGGQHGWGTVFQVAQSLQGVSETILYSFQGGSDGGLPVASLVPDSMFNLYGTTEVGGSANCASNDGCGSVFQLVPPVSPGSAWSENILYAFQGGNDGSSPEGALVLSGNWLVGLTVLGGGSQACNTANLNGCGVAFAVRK